MDKCLVFLGKNIAAVFVLFFWCGVHVAQANLQLTFNVSTLTQELKSDPEDSEPSITTLFVTLGTNYFSYREGSRKTIHDFQKRRIFMIDTNEGTYSDDSLFMDIGFRTYEFRNRLILGRTLDASEIKDHPMARTLSEHLFSLSDKDNQSRLTKEQRGRSIVFSWEGKELFEYNMKSSNVDPGYRDAFVRFLRYYVGGHPQVLKELGNRPGIPSRLRIVRYSVNKETKDVALTSHKKAPDEGYEIRGLKKANIEGELSRLVPGSRFYSPPALEKHTDGLLSEASAAFNAGHYLDAMLAYLEHTLVTGKQLPRQFQSHRERIRQDPYVASLLPAINPPNKEKAEEAVKILERLRTHSEVRKHVLIIFEANVRTSLGDPDTAKRLFMSALTTNPYIAGAWKDLGDLYLRSYNARDAWWCWDLARKIAPDHRLVVPINKLEQKLLKRYPEFF